MSAEAEAVKPDTSVKTEIASSSMSDVVGPTQSTIKTDTSSAPLQPSSSPVAPSPPAPAPDRAATAAPTSSSTSTSTSSSTSSVPRSTTEPAPTAAPVVDTAVKTEATQAPSSSSSAPVTDEAPQQTVDLSSLTPEQLDAFRMHQLSLLPYRLLCIACGSKVAYTGTVQVVRCPVCRTVNAVWPETHSAGGAPRPPSLVEQCMQWSEIQVAVFLEHLGCDPATANALLQHHVDGPQLLDLTYSDMQHMGVKHDVYITKVIQAIKVIRQGGIN